MTDAVRVDSIETAWKRVERWLHANAAGDFEALAPPESVDRIARIADRFDLHPQLFELLAMCNGSSMTEGIGLIFRYELLSVDHIQLVKERPWIGRRKLVPFAATSTGEYLLVNHEPGQQYGAVVEIDLEVGDEAEFCWVDLVSMLNDLARALKSGEPTKFPSLDVWYQRVGDGWLDWNIT